VSSRAQHLRQGMSELTALTGVERADNGRRAHGGNCW